MQFQTQGKVTGATQFNDTVEGVTYDFTKLHIETSLDDSKGNAKGSATVAYEFGKSDEFKKMEHLSFPFMADLTMELVTTGKVQKQRVVAMKPLAMVKASDTK